MLLENDLVEFSILRAYPLQGPTTSCTLIAPRSPDRKTTSVDQLCSIERPMYAQWVVFPLEWPVSHIAFPYGMWSSAADFPFRHSCLTDVYKDLVRTKSGSSYNRESTPVVIDRVVWLQTMRGPNLPLGEWFRILPSVVSGYPVSPVHILQHLSCVCTWG